MGAAHRTDRRAVDVAQIIVELEAVHNRREGRVGLAVGLGLVVGGNGQGGLGDGQVRADEGQVVVAVPAVPASPGPIA
jgi:hypothetical protein